MRPYLRVANVFKDRIDTSDVMKMNFSPEEYESYKLHAGDILLNEGQSLELVGRPAIYRDEVPGSCFTNTLVRFRAGPLVTPEFALLVFLSYLESGRFQRIATITVNIAHLGAGRFAGLEFPLPPRREQEAICTEVTSALSLVTAAEQSVIAELKRSDVLRRAILKHAFEGRLVPQDPKDEPASRLLDRIKADREGTQPKKLRAASRKRATKDPV
jgi:type I restriction enzyme S subunit